MAKCKNNCKICDEIKSDCINDVCSESDFYSKILKEKNIFESFGRSESYQNKFREFHPVEALYLVIKNEAFLYFKNYQICLNSFWNLFLKCFGKFGKDYFFVYFYYRQKNWIVRIDTSYGADFQIYPGSPKKYHSPYSIKVLNGDENWINIIGSNRVASSNNKDLILV